MCKRKKISRRSFLGEASCAAVGSTAFLSSIINLSMINTAAARSHILNGPENDYKAIVCILLAGGCDSHNMLVPTDALQFNNYQNIRDDLALNMSDLNTINPVNTNKNYGVHNGMPNTRDLFNDGNLSFISNIGTLIEPITNSSQFYNNNALQIPLGLYSHSDQIMQWQTSVPQDRTAVGVGGRMADILKDMNSIDSISMNISLDGKNRFQAGNSVIEYAINNDASADNLGLDPITTWWSNSGFLTQERNESINSLVEDVYSNIFQDTYGGLTRQTLESVEIFKSALAKKPSLTTSFDPFFWSQDLRMMAEVISVQQFLGAKRQIFFTTFGGWDHHDEVLNNQNTMLPRVDNALGAFYEALEELGCQDQVTTFTISDFARTLTSNGQGSDHAWGGNNILMGGAVNGQRVFGDYPDLTLTNDLNLDERGRMIPTTSVDEFYADLALWFGVSPNDLNYILPNIGNFGSYNTSNPPLGLFNNYPT